MNKTLRKVVLASVLTALSVAIGIMVKFIPGLNLEFPSGGHVFGLYTLPLVVLGMIAGSPFGIIGGLIYGLVSLMLDGTLYHWGSLPFDYILPFAGIGLAGDLVGRKGLQDWKCFVLAFVIAFLIRWVFHGLSGVFFFSTNAGDLNVWIYSFILYNLPYVASSSFLSMSIGLLMRKKLLEITLQFE